MGEEGKLIITGYIPLDWETKELQRVMSFSNGKAHEAFITRDGKFKVVNSKFVSTNGLISKRTDANLAPLLPGDIAIVMSDIPNGKALAKCYLIDRADRYVLNQRVGALRPKHGDSSYFFYQLNRNPYFIAFDSGSGQTNLRKGDILKCPIRLPPTLAEQSAIAQALSDIDALLDSLEKLITKKRSIKQGAMQELFKPRSGWQIRLLGELAVVNMGQSPHSDFYNRNKVGLPLIQGNADIVDRKTIARTYTSVITKKGKAGDIIMSVRAPVGEISKAMFDCCLGRGVCAITFDNEYLYHYLIFLEKSWSKVSTGSTFDSINLKQLKGLEVSMPGSKSEQIEIAKILSDMDAEIDALESKRSKYKQIKTGMMQNLLTGKIRLV